MTQEKCRMFTVLFAYDSHHLLGLSMRWTSAADEALKRDLEQIELQALRLALRT
jgi:hypothetical protein